MPTTVRVNLGTRSYDVHVGTGILNELGSMIRSHVALRETRRALLVVDGALPQQLKDIVEQSLKSDEIDAHSIELESSESNKSIETTTRILHVLAELRLERHEPVIALGGGVVGDVAGFAAAIYRRGVPVIQCPTTLLAMVDASVGGKTGVNLRTKSGLKKNLVGAFWQPSIVIADTAALEWLPDRQLRAGLAESLKHALISRSVPRPDAQLFEWTNRNLVKLRMRDQALLCELVQRNVKVKASVVEQDEREETAETTGGRMLLNLGHTFGHALETIPHLSPDGRPDNAPLHHGEAVALGLVAAGACAVSIGVLDPSDAEQIRVGVERLGLESRIVGLPNDGVVLELMLHDKKVSGGKLRLVLPTSLGEACVVLDPERRHVSAGLEAVRA